MPARVLNARRSLRHACAFALFVALAGSVAAQSAPAAGQAAASAKSCEHARKKIAREQRTAAEVADTLAKSRRARETCVSRSACARYDEAIRDTERRQARQATRLARYEQEVAAACAP